MYIGVQGYKTSICCVLIAAYYVTLLSYMCRIQLNSLSRIPFKSSLSKWKHLHPPWLPVNKLYMRVQCPMYRSQSQESFTGNDFCLARKDRYLAVIYSCVSLSSAFLMLINIFITKKVTFQVKHMICISRVIRADGCSAVIKL